MINIKEINERYYKLMAEHLFERWKEEIPNIENRYLENKEEIDNNLIDIFDKLCKEASKLQKEGDKGKTKYIHFSYLRTSIIHNTCRYRIDIYDKKWYVDEIECVKYWEPNFIYKSLFHHMEDIKEDIKKQSKRVKPMVLEKVKLYEGEKYNILTKEYIKELIPKLVKTKGYKEMDKDEEILIMAGEYIDKSEVIYEGRK
ncbi:hypothetical protein [Dethiothermospora halolimnae]|uniref:hypothetical protein n=1 Tax=Dethiothermospora halolimnae TaxID=3114390 RepID=UPI003CCBDC48